MATYYYRPYTTEPLKEGELPPEDAMEKVLPEFKYIHSMDPTKNKSNTHVDILQLDDPTAEKPSIVRPRNVEDLDQTSLSMLEYQMKELDHYREAVQKMGRDILTLRDQVKKSERENTNLRTQLAHYNDTARMMKDDPEIETLSKLELATRYTNLKQKLSQTLEELKSYRNIVVTLQNDLIKNNDSNKELLAVRGAHVKQQEILQKYENRLKKTKKLEETVRQQEKVIERLETCLRKKPREASNTDPSIHETLLNENRRLREDINELRENGRGDADIEKLELYELLDKAETRVAALEKQLAENARQWGREKAGMDVRTSEVRYGFGRNNLSSNRDMY